MYAHYFFRKQFCLLIGSEWMVHNHEVRKLGQSVYYDQNSILPLHRHISPCLSIGIGRGRGKLVRDKGVILSPARDCSTL